MIVAYPVLRGKAKKMTNPHFLWKRESCAGEMFVSCGIRNTSGKFAAVFGTLCPQYTNRAFAYAQFRSRAAAGNGICCPLHHFAVSAARISS